MEYLDLILERHISSVAIRVNDGDLKRLVTTTRWRREYKSIPRTDSISGVHGLQHYARQQDLLKRYGERGPNKFVPAFPRPPIRTLGIKCPKSSWKVISSFRSGWFGGTWTYDLYYSVAVSHKNNPFKPFAGAGFLDHIEFPHLTFRVEYNNIGKLLP